jgi:hypothetical protein
MFGYKQLGEKAALSDNLYYPSCYEEEINWEEIKVTFSIHQFNCAKSPL